MHSSLATGLLALAAKFELPGGHNQAIRNWINRDASRRILKTIKYLKQHKLQDTKYPGPFYRILFLSKSGFKTLFEQDTIKLKKRDFESWSSNPDGTLSILLRSDKFGVMLRRGKIAPKDVLLDIPWLWYKTDLDYDEDILRDLEEIVTKTYCTTCRWSEVELFIVPDTGLTFFQKLAEAKGYQVKTKSKDYGVYVFIPKGKKFIEFTGGDTGKAINSTPRRRMLR